MGKQNPNTDPLGILQENGKSITDPLGILKNKNQSQNDPLGILKKKDLTVDGAEELNQQSGQQEKPSLENGEAITDRFEISSKLPSNTPEISSREQTLSKAGELSHDIESLKNSEMYQTSIKTINELEQDANLLKSLEPKGIDKLDLTNENEVNAYNTLVEQYNEKRNEYLAKEEGSKESLSFLTTYDNYVKEYNTLLSKSKEGSTKGDVRKSESISEILGIAWDQTAKADLPASELFDRVSRIRRRSNAIHVLKKNKEWASGKIKDIREVNPNREIIKGIENIDVKSAERLKEAVEKTTKEKTKLENDRSKLKKILSSGGYKSIGEKQTIKLDTDKIKSEISELTNQIDKAAITEKKQSDAWDAYMKPVLDNTAEEAIPLAEEAQRLQEWGQKEFGSKLRLSVKDVDGFKTGLEYVAAQAAKSAPYSIHGAVTLGTGMIDIEQGSIEGDILTSLAEREGISIAEVLKRGIDQEGAELAFKKGAEAGLWEFAGQGVALIVPWAKLGLAAKTVIPKNAFVGLLKKSLETIAKLTAAGTGEALTEMKQTDIELTAKYKALGYTDEEIKRLITTDDYIESGVAGFAGSLGLGGPSTLASAVVETRIEAQERKATNERQARLVNENLINADNANQEMLGKAYESVKLEEQTKEQAIDEIRTQVDRNNPEAIQAAAEELEIKINKELEESSTLETKKETPLAEPEKGTKLEDSAKEPISQETVEYKIGDKQYDVKVEDGKLSILDKQGKEPSKSVREKITAKYEAREQVNKPTVEEGETTASVEDIQEATKKETNISPDKVEDKLMQEGKDQVSKGFTMFTEESKQSEILPSSPEKFTQKQVESIQEIGSGLTKQGLATDQNVDQKVKDYFKDQGVSLPKGLIEDVYSVATDKTKAEIRKEKLEKDIEKKNKEGEPVKKKGKYIQRMLADERRVPEFKELLKPEEEYTQQDMNLAEKRSLKFVKDFQREFGEKDGLLEVAKILKANKKTEGFPEIMIGPISSKLETRMNKLGMQEEALSVVKFKQVESRKAGRLLVGIREDASPDEVISLLTKDIRKNKLEKINEEFKEGKTYNQALKEMQTKLDELESAYKKLQETGKIDESFLPDPDISDKTPKSKELKARAKVLRKKGMDNLSAYFKIQRGTMSMGLRIDDKLITALGQIFQSYILEFEGNALAAYDKFKKDVAKNYDQISQEDIDKVKNKLLDQSEDIINEFKDKKKIQIINDILKPDTKETKAQIEDRKEASENILNDLNEGKSIEEVSDNLSKIAKFDKIDPQVLDDILGIAVEYGDLLNEGKLELASTKFDELMDKLYSLGLENRGINEIMMDLWYTSVLSGLTTVRRSLFGSGITSAVFMGFRLAATPSMAPIMFSQMLKGSKGLFQNYYNVLKTGKSNVQINDFKIKRGSYSAMLWRKKFKELSTLNAAAKGIWAIPTFMFRNIVAWDQILKNATSEANYALYEFDNTDKSKTKKQRIKETEDKLMNDKDGEIRNIVQSEIEERKANGEKIESGYKFRRFTEIKNEYRNSEIIKKSMEDAAEAAMVGTPKGTLGRIYKGVINKAEIKKDDTLKIKAGKTMFKFTFPFFRIGFNWINAGLDFTPVGFSRGFSKQVWTKDGMIDRTSFQKRELIAKASTGMILTTSIMLSMFDWDEDEGIKLKDEKDMWIRVYGPLTGDYKNIGDVSLDATPWSIQIIDIFTGEWTTPLKYQDNPIGFALAPIGIMHDEIHFNQFKKDKSDSIDERKLMFLLNGIGMGTFTYAMDKSFNQGINNLFKIVTADSVEDMGRSLKRLVLNPIEGFYPGVYNQLYAQYRTMIGKSEKEYREWYERPLSKIPLVDGIIKNDKVDIFGYPYVRDFDFPFIPDYILKLAKENLDYRENIKAWKLLHKYDNVVIGRFKPPVRDKYKNKLTNQQMDEYMLVAGLRMRKYVEDNYSDLIKKDRKKLQEKLWKYKKWSASYAKGEISKKNP